MDASLQTGVRQGLGCFTGWWSGAAQVGDWPQGAEFKLVKRARSATELTQLAGLHSSVMGQQDGTNHLRYTYVFRLYFSITSASGLDGAWSHGAILLTGCLIK